jgi:hypothetical protein
LESNNPSLHQTQGESEFAKDPTSAQGVARLRGSAGRQHPRAAVLRLPHDWTVTFELYPDGLPPLAGPIIMIRAVVRVWPFEPTDDPDTPAS